MINRISNVIHNQFTLHRNFLIKIDPNVILIIFISLFYFLGYGADNSQSLIAHDEAIYGGRARLILDSNNWFTPFEAPHHKTIGSYWLIAFSMKFLGISELSARLPSAIFSIFSCITTYFLAKKFMSSWASILSSLFLMSSPLWIQYSRYASPDIPYIFFILFSIFCVIDFDEKCSKSSSKVSATLFLSGISIGLAFFLRSFMILLPLAASLPIYIYVFTRSNKAHHITFIFGLIIGLLPTFISLSFALSQYGLASFYSLFGFATDKVVGGSFIKSLFFYPTNIFLLSFPAGLIALYSLKHFYKGLTKLELYTLYIFPLILVILLLFMSSRHAHYTLILYPSISILSALTIDNLLFKTKITQSYFPFYLSIIIFLASICLSTFYLISKLYVGLPILNSLQPIFLRLLPLALIYFIFSISLIFNPIGKKNFFVLLLLLSISQYLTLSDLYISGLMGNPNSEIKYFVDSASTKEILSNNLVYLVDINGKSKTLFQFYIPRFQHHKQSISSLPNQSYIIIDQDQFHNAQKDDSFQITAISDYKQWMLAKINFE